MQDKNLYRTKLKLTILFTVCIFCIVFILGVAFFSFRYVKAFQNEQRLFMEGTQRHIEDLWKSDDILDFLWFYEKSEKFSDVFEKNRRQWERGRSRPISYIVISESGEVLDKSIHENVEIEILQEAREGKPEYEDGVFVRKQKVQFFLEDAIIYFYKHHSYWTTIYISDIGIFTLFLLLFSIVFYVLSYKFVGRTLRPVEENLSDMKDFIHNAGHELKTPIAVLRGNLQILQAERKKDPQLITQGIQEIDRLNALIEGLIELAETGKNSQKEYLDLSKEVTLMIQEFDDLISTQDITIKNTIPKNSSIYGNREELYVLVSNLLKNAITYNRKKWKVDISFNNNSLVVTDTGLWIPQEELEKIFERFYQCTDARSSGGFGIWLSLVKKIVDSNGWKIEVESEKKKGTTFRVMF